MQDAKTDELLPTIAERGELESIDGSDVIDATPDDGEAEPEDADLID